MLSDNAFEVVLAREPESPLTIGLDVVAIEESLALVGHVTFDFVREKVREGCSPRFAGGAEPCHDALGGICNYPLSRSEFLEQKSQLDRNES